MKISGVAFAFLGLWSLTTADETLFRKLEKESKSFQLQHLNVTQSGCTYANVAVRREWGSMSADDRKAYISAVKCLRRKSPLSASVAPGARSRFDDFQAIHINQTLAIHNNAVFHPWHRYFVWAYERALREECGYEGYQPYWEWSPFADNPTSSPLFDGSETSMSGNGAKVPHGAFSYVVPFSPNLTTVKVPQDGGGCLVAGPFANATVNLGPVNSTGSLPGFVGSGTGLDYNPRCLVRDMGSAHSKEVSWDSVVEVLNTTNFANFDTAMQLGPHSGGHNTVGSQMSDFFASPGDPIFMFHHAQVDRIWTLWQNLDIDERGMQLQGFTNPFNNPPAANITLDFPVDLGVIAPQVEVGTLMSTFDGPFCYRYE